MKKTHFLELIKTIGRTKVSFISIIIFVALGITLFLGITWSGDTVAKSADDYFDRGVLHDFEVQSVYGFTDDEIAKIKAIDGVDQVEGEYQTYRVLKREGKTFKVRITSLSDNIDIPLQSSGRLPNKNDELALEIHWAANHGYEIGDKIVFEGSDKEYTVTALMAAPDYLSTFEDMYGVSYPDSIPVTSIMYMAKSAFPKELYGNYPSILVRNERLREYSVFSDEYFDLSNEIKKEIEEVTDEFDKGETGAMVTGRYENTSVAAIDVLLKVFSDLRFSMAGLFVIVGLLICFFSVSRIVYDQTILVGTKKALGITKKEVSNYFLVYAIAAAIIGSFLGLIFARFIVEPILVPMIRDTYGFDNTLYVASLKGILIFAAFEVVIQALTAKLACHKILKRSAVSLLQGEEPPKSKTRFFEKSKFWQNLSLYGKTIVNNFFNDRRRVLSTIVGIASCTALIVCALTLNNCITGSFTKQYDVISPFDTVLYFDTHAEEGKIAEIKEALDDDGINFAEVFSTQVSLETPESKHYASPVFVVDDPKFYEIFNVRDLEGEEHELEDDIWVGCAYTEEYDCKPGDTIRFTDVFQKEHEAKIAGGFEYYLIQNQILMSRAAYEKEFDGEFEPNLLLLDRNDYDFNKLEDELSDNEAFIYLDDYYTVTKKSFDAFATVFALVVALYLVLACAMAFLVLLNLLVMFIEEKRKELIILMINGYELKRVKKYIYSDTIFLTVISIILGIVFGNVMANISLGAYRTCSMYFLSGVNIAACVIAVVFTCALVLITSLIALKRVKNFSLTEINK